MATPNHCLIIGLDGAVPEVVEHYARVGLLPNISMLMKSGAWSENCLPPLPNTSPACWATVATGASPATHGVTGSNLYDNKLPLTETRAHEGYLSGSTKAETLWEAAERAGMRSLLVSYPTSWPPKTSGPQIGTTDTSATDGSFGIKHQLFSTEDIPFGSRISLEPGGGTLRARLTPELEPGYWIVDKASRSHAVRIKPFSWSVEITRENDVAFYAQQGPRRRLATLRKGQWSRDLEITLQTATGPRILRCRIKVIAVSYRARRLIAYVTRMVAPPCVHPSSLESMVGGIPGIPSYRDHFNAPKMDSVDLDTFIEIQEMGFDWMASAVRRCRRGYPCQLTCVYTVSVDTVNHLYRNILEKEQIVPAKALRAARDVERRTYQAIDSFIGKLLSIRRKNRLVVLVSDHSAVTYGHDFTIDEALRRAGLLVTKKTSTGEEIVLTKSKAICQREVHIYVNLKGRNPGGVVEKKDFDDVVHQIIAALYDYTDPATNRKPVALALRREDAGLVGLCGDGIGDVVVAVRGGFGRLPGDEVHGHRLPGGEHNGKRMRCLLLLSGPGIRRNVRIQRTAFLRDIAPTIAYLMKFPAPRDTEGGILYQMLEDQPGL